MLPSRASIVSRCQCLGVQASASTLLMTWVWAAGRRRSNAAEPGPPVGGALHRIDQWPPDCAADGTPLANQVGLAVPRISWHSSCRPGQAYSVQDQVALILQRRICLGSGYPLHQPIRDQRLTVGAGGLEQAGQD